MLINILRVKNSHYIEDAYNVDPVYLKHEMQGKIPDFRVINKLISWLKLNLNL